MTTEFRSSIVLDAEKATQQAIRFNDAIRKSSNTLDKFHSLTAKVAQGGTQNIFRKYELSQNRLDIKFRNIIASVHDSKKGIDANIASIKKLNAEIEKLNANGGGNSEKLANKKLNDISGLEKTIAQQKNALVQVNNLNAKYDENARVLRKLKTVRNELNYIVAAGLQTEKRAQEIYKRESEAIHKTTKVYKDAYEARKKSVIGRREEQTSIRALQAAYDSEYASVLKIQKVKRDLYALESAGRISAAQSKDILRAQTNEINKNNIAYLKAYESRRKAVLSAREESKELSALRAKYDSDYATRLKNIEVNKRLILVKERLNALEASGRITNAQKIHALKKEEAEINKVVHAQKKLNNEQGFFVRFAKNVSVATRITLAGYLAYRTALAGLNLVKTADSITLLDNKLRYFTGDGGAYKKFYEMTQDVGIKIQDANKIITRFAVVTNGAFNVDTMNDWSAALVKSARATGTSTQEMTGALIQITQAMSAGRLMGDEYRSVTENLPLLTVALRQVFKGAGLSLKELSSKGFITTQKMIESFEKLKEIVAGIPGTTNTVEAKIDKLSSAWDNFINKITNTSIVKNSFDFIADQLTRLANIMGSDTFAEKSKNKLDELNKARNLAESLKASEDFGSDKKYGFSFPSLDENNEVRTILRFTTYENAYNETIKAKNALLKEYIALKKNADREAKGLPPMLSDEEELVKKNREIQNLENARDERDAFVNSILNEKDINKILIERKLLIDQINDKAKRTESNLAPIDEVTRLKLIAKAEKDANEEILKEKQKYINEYLRLNKLPTSAKKEEIEDYLEMGGKFLAIEKEFNKKQKEIEALYKTGIKEQSLGLKIGDMGGINKDQYEIFNAKNEQNKAELIKNAINEVKVELDSLLNFGNKTKQQTPLEIYNDKVQDATIKIQKNLNKADEIFNELDENRKAEFGTLDAFREKIKSVGEEYLKYLELQRNKAYIDEFSPKTKAVNEYTEALKRLNEAKEQEIITSKEAAYAEEQLRKEMEKTKNLAMARSGEMSDSDQFFAAIKDSMSDFTDSQLSTYEMLKKTSDDLFSGMTDQIHQFVMTGKADFRGMAYSIISDLIKMQIQAILSETIKSTTKIGFIQKTKAVETAAIAQTTAAQQAATASSTATSAAAAATTATAWSPAAALSSLASFGANAAPAIAAIGLVMAAAKAFKNGGAFGNGGVEMFANGGAFTNSVVSKPTLFKFANGVGMMGEDGPEAIMPLKRNSSGKLGVVAERNGANNQQPIIVQSPPITVVNVQDKSMINEWAGSSEGENFVLNILTNNPERVKGIANNG